MQRVGIVDPGVGCACSARLAFERICGQLAAPCDVRVVSTLDEASECDALVLAPRGVFAAVASALERSGLALAIRKHAASGRPLLAIDLGMQVLFDECQGVRGLGIVAGAVVPMVPSIDVMLGQLSRVPHVGWNRLMLEACPCPVLEAAGRPGTWVYFDHSMKVIPKDGRIVSSTTEHGAESIVASICVGRLVGTQFRPERSQRAGIRMIVAFVGGERP